MKTFVLAVMCALAFASRGYAADEAKDGAKMQLDPKLVQGSNQFAFELYGKLRSAEGNLFFSPTSISTAFAMTYVGARGDTAGQMSKVLHFPQDVNQTSTEFASLVKQLNGDGKDRGYKLSIANAIWGQKGHPFAAAFLTTLKDSYAAPLTEMDFKTAAEPARQEINGWVAKQTADKIKDLVPPGAIDGSTRLVLTNAVYFKGDWADKFDPKLTHDGDFVLAPGQKTTTPLMNRGGSYGYAQVTLAGGAKAQLLELPYANNALSMLILLPEKMDGIADVEQALSVEKLQEWAGKLRKQEVHVSLPKFKTTAELSLKETLSSMGMPLAFSDQADFSGMTGKPDLCISAAIHKAYVDVNEEGTEAAGSTAIIMKPTAVPRETPVFRADHPFVYIIRENGTGAVLFIGRLSNPVG